MATTTTTTTTPTVVKTEAHEEKPLTHEEELQVIKKQVEFYFGDSNLPRDKFLKAQITLNQGGFVPITTILSFKRMKSFTSEKVIEALASSTLVELNPEKIGIRRAQPPAEDDTSIARTVYVKGWPTQTIIDEVEKFYAPHGTVLSVRFRRFPTSRVFKGSLFVEFATEEEAQSVLSKKPQLPPVEAPVLIKEVKDEAGPSSAPAIIPRELIYLAKTEWSQEKHEELQKFKTKAQNRKVEENEQLKKQKKQKGGDKDKDKKEEKKEWKSNFAAGSLVKFSNIPAGFTRFTLKPIFEQFGLVRFVDYKNDDDEGYVRFQTETSPLEMIKSFTEKNTLIGDRAPEFQIVGEDEEREYWTQLTTKIAKESKKRKGKGGKGGKKFSKVKRAKH